jgi:hypothetical protein
MDTRPREAVLAEVAASPRLKRLAVVSVVLAVAALAVVFVPVALAVGAVFGLVGLTAGVVCLVRDPGFNLPALAGTVLSSAAVSIAGVLAVVRAIV